MLKRSQRILLAGGLTPMIRACLRCLAVLLLVVFLAPMLNAQRPAAAADLAQRRSPQLARGINLSSWFAQNGGDFSQSRIDAHTTAADLRLIHSLGFTWVRLGIDPVQLMRYGLDSPDSAQALARVDRAIRMCLDAQLSVAITVFPEDNWKQELNNQTGADRLIFLWRFLAHHYATLDPDHVFFELMNEPTVADPYRWDGLQAALVAAVRESDRQHTIIATAARWSGLDDLLRVTPVRDANVIYNFHFYEPYPFSHQGANWGSFEWNYFHQVPYPATPETMRAVLGTVPDASARYNLFLYASAGWNRDSMLQRLNFVRAWADERHVPVICDEFGAYRQKAPADSRARYIHDVRSSLETLGIGWAMWDYSGDFGLVTKVSGQTTSDAAIVEALGLHASR